MVLTATTHGRLLQGVNHKSVEFSTGRTAASHGYFTYGKETLYTAARLKYLRITLPPNGATFTEIFRTELLP
jgi:hypothetical protein